MKKIIALGLSFTLLGAGCATTTSPIPSPVPVPNATAEPVAPSAVIQTPTPAPSPTPTPVTKPTATKPVPKPVTKTITVEIRDNVFSPQIIAVNAGDTVVWKNVGKNGHTVHSSTGVLWDSGTLAPNATYSHVFPATGSYSYYCTAHSGMAGTVIVGEIRAQN